MSPSSFFFFFFFLFLLFENSSVGVYASACATGTYSEASDLFIGMGYPSVLRAAVRISTVGWFCGYLFAVSSVGMSKTC